MSSFALRIMDGSADVTEQWRYAQRLMAVGQRLQRRADGTAKLVIEGQLVVDETFAFPAHTPGT